MITVGLARSKKKEQGWMIYCVKILHVWNVTENAPQSFFSDQCFPVIADANTCERFVPLAWMLKVKHWGSKKKEQV